MNALPERDFSEHGLDPRVRIDPAVVSNRDVRRAQQEDAHVDQHILADMLEKWLIVVVPKLEADAAGDVADRHLDQAKQGFAEQDDERSCGDPFALEQLAERIVFAAIARASERRGWSARIGDPARHRCGHYHIPINGSRSRMTTSAHAPFVIARPRRRVRG